MWWVKWHLKQAQSYKKYYLVAKGKYFRGIACKYLKKYRHERKMARKHLLVYKGLDGFVDVKGC